MIPFQLWRVLLTIGGFSLFIAAFDWLAQAGGGTAGERDALSTIITGCVIAAFPRLAPRLLPALAKGRLAFSVHAERVVAQLYQVLPPDFARPRLIILEVARPLALAVGTKRRPVVFISVALIIKLSDEDLRAVLAHEMGHLDHGHSVQTCLFLAGLFLIKAFYTMPLVLVIGAFLSYLGILRHQEFQADEFGARLVPVRTMQAMLARLAELSGEKTDQRSRWQEICITVLSTHPSFRERILMLNKSVSG